MRARGAYPLPPTRRSDHLDAITVINGEFGPCPIENRQRLDKRRAEGNGPPQAARPAHGGIRPVNEEGMPGHRRSRWPGRGEPAAGELA